MELKNTSYEITGRVATIWLDRPHRMNAWTGRYTEYRHLVERANNDPEVGAIVVTGRGRGFCVGGDSQALTGHSERGSYDAGITADIAKPGYGVNPHFDATFAYHFGLTKPVIAAINGPAAGIGLALACFADVRFAVPGVKFTTAHGTNCPANTVALDAAAHCWAWACEHPLLTSRVFMSDEAERIGFVNQLHSPETLLAAAQDYATNLVETVSLESLRQTRWQVYQDLHGSVAESVNQSEQLLEAMMRDDDYREGVKAF